MITRPFDYVGPPTRRAAAALADAPDDVAVLGGGTMLVPDMTHGRAGRRWSSTSSLPGCPTSSGAPTAPRCGAMTHLRDRARARSSPAPRSCDRSPPGSPAARRSATGAPSAARPATPTRPRGAGRLVAQGPRCGCASAAGVRDVAAAEFFRRGVRDRARAGRAAQRGRRAGPRRRRRHRLLQAQARRGQLADRHRRGSPSRAGRSGSCWAGWPRRRWCWRSTRYLATARRSWRGTSSGRGRGARRALGTSSPTARTAPGRTRRRRPARSASERRRRATDIEIDVNGVHREVECDEGHLLVELLRDDSA